MSAPTAYHPRGATRALARRGAAWGRLLREIGPVRIPQQPSTFETLARSIVYQQLSGHAARAIWGRLVARFEPQALTPEGVLRRRPATLRAAGLSWNKVESLRDLARHVRSGRLVPEALEGLDDEAVEAAITQVRGLGPWSAHMHLIFALARPDVWPTADLGVRKGLARFLGLTQPPSPKETQALGEAWRPWRTVVAWAMWRIHDVEEWA